MKDNLMIDVIIPTCRSTYFVECLIKSFEKYKGDYEFTYYVIENSNFTEDNKYIKSLSRNIVIENNLVDFSNDEHPGSKYNSSGCELGLKLSSSNLVFFAHNDVVATKNNWIKGLHDKISQGYGAASFLRDNIRINALHISGLLTTRKIATSVNLYYKKDQNGRVIHDAGDEITEYCRNSGLETYYHRNTHNNPELKGIIKKPFDTMNVVRCLDDNNDVVFMHCGRGTVKIKGQYSGNGVSVESWVNFANNTLGLDLSGGNEQ